MSKVKTTTTAKRGRPTVEGSKRQAVLAMRAAKVAAGGEIKRGRPATRNKTTEITVEVKVKPSKAQRQAAMKKPAMIEVADVNEAIEA
jgi:hypothetical protein